MFSPNVDLGQIILVSAVSVIGYFVKHTIDNMGARLDKHEERLFKLTENVQRLVGIYDSRQGERRRT